MARNHNRVRILIAPYVHAGGVAITVGQADPRPARRIARQPSRAQRKGKK